MNTSPSRKYMLITAWLTIAAVSLPVIITREIFHRPYSESMVYGVSFVILAAGLLLTFLWKSIRPLRMFFGLFVVLLGAQWLVFTRLDQIPTIRSWLTNPSFGVFMLTEQSLKLVVTLLVIAFLLLLKKRASAFFLTRGNTAAPVAPISWLGVKSGATWNRFGPILVVCISLGTLAFLVIGGRPSLGLLVKALPLLPAVFLAAAMNAFNEEMTYKASFLSVLEDAVGPQQALLLMAVFFGFLHFYGVPYGVVGVIMATFLGWILGKSMLETRGLFWAWFIHFWQDVLIFIFLAIGSITPGG